VYTCEVINEIR